MLNPFTPCLPTVLGGKGWPHNFYRVGIDLMTFWAVVPRWKYARGDLLVLLELLRAVQEPEWYWEDTYEVSTYRHSSRAGGLN